MGFPISDIFSKFRPDNTFNLSIESILLLLSFNLYNLGHCLTKILRSSPFNLLSFNSSYIFLYKIFFSYNLKCF